MTSQMIEDICVNYGGAVRSGSDFELSAAVEAQLFIALGADALSVPKVVRLSLLREYLVATTGKGEQFFFGYADVTGIKLARTDEGRGERKGERAGFIPQ